MCSGYPEASTLSTCCRQPKFDHLGPGQFQTDKNHGWAIGSRMAAPCWLRWCQLSNKRGDTPRVFARFCALVSTVRDAPEKNLNFGASLKTRLRIPAVQLVSLAIEIQLGGHGYLWKALAATYLRGYQTANIDDASNFAQRPIRKDVEQPWPKDRRYDEGPLDPELLAPLRQQDSAAFLVLQDGALVHETYFGNYQASSRTNSFSMAKTITTLQVALATLAQLSSMKSGHDWTENYYTPLNITTNLYYGDDAASLVLRQGFEREPGTDFEYSSGSTQLMGVFLKRALEAREPV